LRRLWKFLLHSKRLRRVLLGAGLFVAIAAAALGWFLSAPAPAFPESAAAELEKPGDAGHGRVVFEAGDCASCHATPGQEDRHLLGGGMALASLFGTFHPPNISPDPEHGIGRWRIIDLANALMSGVSPAGKHYYPALPYVDYAHMSATDVRDLMAYLRTLPPATDEPPAHELPFPMTIRRLVGFWKLIYLDRSPVGYDPGHDAEWNRGKYLVEALGHCAECHSSRDIAGGIKMGTRYAGGADQENVGFVPNITPTGIGPWSRDELQHALTTGVTPRGRVLGSTMAEVVIGIAALPEADQQAIAAYIKSIPPRPTRSP
jgi:mono/diheme cytochrome c family protein